MLDTLNRPLHDLRISVTDRCNFRCRYCMPRESFEKNHPFLPHAELLTFEEIVRLAKIFHTLGVRKIRLTGGEPLLRKDIEILVKMLASALPDVDLAMTTNGSLLAGKAQALKNAGLHRITISLDALDDEIFRAITDVDYSVEGVLNSIRAAEEAGLTPIKINTVVKRGVNEGQILPLARYFRGTGHILRFIEFMDVGSTNHWESVDVVPAREIIATIQREFPLEPLDPNYRGEVANRWRYVDGQGEIGLIASVTQPFCGDCTRIRLSAVGELFTCLFAGEGQDVRALLRGGGADAEITAFIHSLWNRREDRYSELRQEKKQSHPNKVEMSYIGG
ncbi:MAG: GTP 3',8-cyclase MoaA [Chloroflexota bacterium]|nr:MAG: GTP 3',8-cyclase MoaA [Chloroflexota bacterium]